MKKFFLAAFFLFSFGAYALEQRTADAEVVTPSVSGTVPTKTVDDENPPLTRNTTTKTAVPTATPATPTTATPSPVSTPAPQPKTSQYVDGSYTGSVADAYYGNIQVKVVISGGKITDVVFLQYPNDRSTSRNINTQAMPYLRSEALDAQSANVSGVSGASDTSMAFVESLSAALAQAKS